MLHSPLCRTVDEAKGLETIMAATEPIRDKKHLHAMANYFLQRGQFRNYVLLSLGVHTALRIGDLLRLRWEDVYDEETDTFRAHITLTEHKTGKQKTVALNKQAIRALRLYFPYRRGAYIFASRRGNGPISRVQAWRVIRGAAEAIGLMGKIGCHSLRKTWGYHAWTSGSVSPVVIIEVYNHSSYAVTKRYLGVTQDDLDRAYLGMELL